MNRSILVIIPLFLLMLNCQDHRIPGDWDYYEEGKDKLQISDTGLMVVGATDLGADSLTIIDSMAMEVTIDHPRLSSLDIMLIYGIDTIMIWSGNYLGERQVVSIDSFNGKSANLEWGIGIIDNDADGQGGWLTHWTIMVRYK